LGQPKSSWALVIQVTAEKSDFKENNINVIFFYKSGCQAIENMKIKITVWT